MKFILQLIFSAWVIIIAFAVGQRQADIKNKQMQECFDSGQSVDDCIDKINWPFKVYLRP
jgi:hypothetical protein